MCHKTKQNKTKVGYHNKEKRRIIARVRLEQAD